VSPSGARPDDDPGEPASPGYAGRQTARQAADEASSGPLRGMRVLVPRGGPWGEAVADDVRRLGGAPIIAPLVDFAPPLDEGSLAEAVAALRAGAFDWLVVTSATTVDALVARGAALPDGTRVAAVGSATAEACRGAGFPVTLVGSGSARDLAARWPSRGGRVLLPHSDLADEGLADDLTALGATVDAVVAYRTVAVPVDASVRSEVAAGRIGAVLVTSGSVARQLVAQFGALPPGMIVACLGPRTAADATAAGLDVDLVAPARSAAALVEALAEHVGDARRA
jgi:uroporphyrinogen-III synthase